jgi:hypothetical protein
MDEKVAATAVAKVMKVAATAVAKLGWEPAKIVEEIESLRITVSGTIRIEDFLDVPEIELKAALLLLAATKMEPEEIAATVFFIGDGHHQGVPLRFESSSPLNMAHSDFAYNKRTGQMEMVPFPQDIVRPRPMKALALAIRLNYTRIQPGLWVDSLSAKTAKV